MPWHIETDHAGCDGYAVVKDADGELEGCHRTRNQAERQLAALYAAEPGVEDRAGAGPAAIVTDIDGTLVTASGPNQQLVDRLNAYDGDVIVVTARSSSRRPETERLLDSIGLDYQRLIMSDGGDAVFYKRDVMERLLEAHTINVAYENNGEVRAAYRDLGVDARNPFANRQAVSEMLARYLDPR